MASDWNPVFIHRRNASWESLVRNRWRDDVERYKQRSVMGIRDRKCPIHVAWRRIALYRNSLRSLEKVELEILASDDAMLDFVRIMAFTSL